MTRKDIRLHNYEDKARVYEQVHALYRKGNPVTMAEHDSGFPAVTVDCEDIHILTDILSLERWWLEKREQERRE